MPFVVRATFFRSWSFWVGVGFLVLAGWLWWQLYQLHQVAPLSMRLFEYDYGKITAQGLRSFYYSPAKELSAGTYELRVFYAIENQLPTVNDVATITSRNYYQPGQIFAQRQLALVGKQPGIYQESYRFQLTKPTADLEIELTTTFNNFAVRSVFLAAPQTQLAPPWQLLDWRLAVGSGVIAVLVGGTIWLMARLPSVRAVVVVLCCFALAARWWLPGHDRLTGDEPHYLAMTKNIVVNGSLDMEQAYQPAMMAEFVSEPVAPHAHRSVKDGVLYSHHSYFMGLALLPGYLLGGVKGAQLQVAVFAALGLVLTYLLSRRLGGSALAAAAIVTFLLISPYAFYAVAIYPEIFAAVLFLAAVYAGLYLRFRWQLLSCLGLGLAVLLNGKYLGPALVLGVMVALLSSWLAGKPLPTWVRQARVVGLLSVLILTILINFGFNWILYGEFGLFTYYSGGRGLDPYQLSLSKLDNYLISAFAQFFDSRAGLLVWLPAAIISLVGFLNGVVQPNRRLRVVNWALMLAVLSYQGLYFLSGSLGGEAPPLRPWVAVLPLLAVLASQAWASWRWQPLLILWLWPSLYLILGAIKYDAAVITVYTYWVNTLFYRIQPDSFNNFGLYLPLLTDETQLTPHTILAIGWVSLAILGLLIISLDFSQPCQQSLHWRRKIANWLAPHKKRRPVTSRSGNDRLSSATAARSKKV